MDVLYLPNHQVGFFGSNTAPSRALYTKNEEINVLLFPCEKAMVVIRGEAINTLQRY